MTEDPAKKLSVSMPESTHEGMLGRMKQLNIKKPSRYIQLLIERDMRERPRQFVIAAESPPDYGRHRPTKAQGRRAAGK